MLNIIVVIQARMGSTRLPGKIIRDLNGMPLVIRLIDNMKKSKFNPHIVVATSINKENDILVQLLEYYNIDYYRGDEYNVLSRFLYINDKYKPEIIVRATADDPLMSAECMDHLIEELLARNLDYVFMKDVPIGVSPEVIRASCFSKLNAYDLNDEDKEHVTMYFKKHEELFNVQYIDAIEKFKCPLLSLTVDTENQFKQIEKLYKIFGEDLSVEKAIDYVKEKNCNPV